MPMTISRHINLSALLSGYRAACLDAGLSPETGNPADCTDAGWWKNPDLWENGPNRSSTEAAALANIAAEARAAAGAMRPLSIIDLLKEALAEDAAERAALRNRPLRELHAARGVVVEDVNGVRMEIPVKRAAA